MFDDFTTQIQCEEIYDETWLKAQEELTQEF